MCFEKMELADLGYTQQSVVWARCSHVRTRVHLKFSLISRGMRHGSFVALSRFIFIRFVKKFRHRTHQKILISVSQNSFLLHGFAHTINPALKYTAVIPIKIN